MILAPFDGNNIGRIQGSSQKFVSEGGKTGGQKSPSVVQGQSPGGRLGGEAPAEAEDIYAINHCNKVLTKKTIFSAWEFPGGHVPLVPPSLHPWTDHGHPADNFSADNCVFMNSGRLPRVFVAACSDKARLPKFAFSREKFSFSRASPLIGADTTNIALYGRTYPEHYRIIDDQT